MNNRDACLAFVRLLLTALLIAIMVPALDASPAAAQQDRGAICMWQTVTGTIDDSNPEDRWHFDANAGDVVTIRMVAREDSGLDPYVGLLDSAGNEIAEAERYLIPVQMSGIYNIVIPSTGTYSIAATRYNPSGRGASGGYVLTLEQGIPRDVSIVEDNIVVGGGLIFGGETVYGGLDNTNSSDAWVFWGRSGDNISVSMEAGGNIDSGLSVFRLRDNERLKESPYWEDDAVESHTLVIPENGWYVIWAWRAGNNQAGTYELTLTGSGGERPRTTECASAITASATEASGDAIDITTPPYEQLSVEQSAAILNNTPSVEGAVANASAITPYVFAANEGDAIMIRMMRTSGNLIPLLGVQDMAGLLDRASADLSGRQATLSLTIPETGWYAVLATREGAEEGTTTGDFLLTFEGSTVEGGGPPDIRQPAVAATAGQTFEDEITEEDFVFYYLINVGDGQGLVITMRRADGNLEPFVAIMDTELNVLLRGRPNLAGTESALAFKPEEGGWYVIAATRADFDAGTTTGVYTLDVQSQ